MVMGSRNYWLAGGCFGVGVIIGLALHGQIPEQKPDQPVKPWTFTDDSSPLKAGQYLTVSRAGEQVSSIYIDVHELCKR
jgi:hypothetical protein